MSQVYIGLLRGINVGRHKRIKMIDLQKSLSALPIASVKTYIQSGNIVFSSKLSAEDLEQEIKACLQRDYDMGVATLVKTPKEIKDALENNPFEGEKRIKSSIALLSRPVTPVVLTEDFSPDEYYITPNCVYLYALHAVKSKLSNNFFEKKLKVDATTRNIRTLARLVEMAEEI